MMKPITLTRSVSAIAALLMLGASVFVMTSRAKAPRPRLAAPIPPPMALEDLPETLPIGGAVVPAALVIKGSGDIKTDDVITITDEQVNRKLSEISGSVTLYRGEKRLHLKIDKSVRIESEFVMRMFARRLNSEAQIGDVITSIDRKSFSSGREFAALAMNANLISFVRDGVRMTRKVSRLAAVGAGGNKLVGECFDCRPWTPGYCVDGSCHEQQDPMCPCGYCGVFYPEGDPNPLPEAHCCQVYQ